MKRLLSNHPLLCLLALALGVISTLAYDLPLHLNWVADESRTEQALSAVSLPFRLFTYAVFFVSFPMLAERLVGQPHRAVTLFWAWSLPAVLLALLMWALLASGAPIFYADALKRFVPGMMARFAPDFTLAEVALGPWRTALYSWPTAIGAELLALLLIPAALARFVRRVAEEGRPWRAWLVPVRGAGLLVVYALVVRWSYQIDFDVFVGDALLGTALSNALSLPLIVIYGGFTAPAVWVGVIAATNVWLIMIWDREQVQAG